MVADRGLVNEIHSAKKLTWKRKSCSRELKCTWNIDGMAVKNSFLQLCLKLKYNIVS